MAEVNMGDFMGETELDRAIARGKELERENRLLWYANVLLRQASSIGTTAIVEGNPPDCDRATEIDAIVDRVDEVLGGIVGLVTAKE